VRRRSDVPLQVWEEVDSVEVAAFYRKAGQSGGSGGNIKRADPAVC
jgi:hypothetical protein